MEFKIFENQHLKKLVSAKYKYLFSKKTGAFMRWGVTENDDPERSPFGPEILDLEISTGACLGKCNFCYKCNGTQRVPTKHMTLETFKRILDRFVTQIDIELEDGNKISIPAWEKVTMKDGSKKPASELCDGDEIGIF